ncbi:2-dehydropantoate 2-reductase [Ruficoccus sp. ZRK36]|uniref:2-dehydropantoate 2-reductase n=1 Tax=Ruficoccus sp. ZRK36 TaxID=2866311 RepID=UPI001C73BD70|nr:2-dehydropantoate 2-reductase [Ruficoccus sp. ZRK36]QYY36998.1 2-dehydropantoate 2-reductase [Ruficoccus sp. ZRK36]
MFKDKPRVAIVGAGAIGAYYGCHLARVGCDVHFLLRSDYEAVMQRGYIIRKEQEEFTVHPVQGYTDPRKIGPCDLVIVALKSTANRHLKKLVAPLVDEHTLVLTLQNGMGNTEKLAEFVPAVQILAGLCFVCLNRVEPGVIENYMAGRIFIGEFMGSYRQRTVDLVELFERAGIDCFFSRSLDESLWRKLVWNIPFNGLAIAAGGVTTDEIMASEHLTLLARELMKEVQAAARAHGHEIEDAFLDSQIEETRKMDAYKPSSMLDFVAGREVEVEAIFGEPLRRGQSKNVVMPRLETLYYLLKGLCPEPERNGSRAKNSKPRKKA